MVEARPERKRSQTARTVEVSGIHSNAYNFLSAVQTGVDPRTGMYTCTISLPGVAANNLCGPTLSVAVAFSALNATNVGFGIGWSLTTTRYDGPRKRLSLSSGGSFVVDTPSAKAPGDLRSRSTARAVEPFACRLSVVAVEFAVVFTAIVGVVFNVVDGRARDRRLDSGR